MIRMLYVRFVVVGVTLLSGGNLMAEQDAMNSDLDNILNEGLGSIDENYRGQHRYFNDDLVGNLFSNIGDFLVEHVINPFINGVAHGDPLCLIGAVVLALVGIGFFHRMGGRLFDSIAGRPHVPEADAPKKS